MIHHGLEFEDILMEQYEIRFPHFCRKCYGVGVVELTDSVPYGSGSASYSSIENCACVEEGCPQCRCPDIWDFDAEEFVPCPVCGWDESKYEDYGHPLALTGYAIPSSTGTSVYDEFAYLYDMN